MAMQTPDPRAVTLVLCRLDGVVLGALPPLEVEVPWWQEVTAVVEAVRQAHGVDVVILRLLAAEEHRLGAGGPVTYLAEVADDLHVPVLPWPAARDADHPLRAPWARPGGPADDLTWADGVLELAGMPRTSPGVQVRTWNLSSLWRLPTGQGSAWLKVVPSFFAHEGAILSALDDDRVPEVLGTDGARTLLVDVPGVDLYGIGGDRLPGMIDLLVDLQLPWVARVDDLLALGLPDWRREALSGLVETLVERWRDRLPATVVAGLDRLLAGLPERWAQIEACGVPDTLVHGDFHQGNLRSAGPGHLVLLDWGDSGVGHPMLDRAAFLERLSPEDQAVVQGRWDRRWQREVPGCEPDRAARLLEPVGALRQALIYQVFLDGIEPDERIYHAQDPARWLARAAAFADG
jgi:hypothetical protein